jgi:hypothetical protein
MLADFTSVSDDTWNNLQEPTRAGREASAPLLRLLAALDSGWRVEEPIYLRARWSEGSARVYCFILHRQPHEAPRLLTVPVSTAVEQFVRSEGFKVLH